MVQAGIVMQCKVESGFLLGRFRGFGGEELGLDKKIK